MKLSKVVSVGLAAAMTASLAACGASSTPEAGAASSSAKSGDNVIKIGVFEPTTGENGGGGFQEVLGIRYANETHKTVKIGDVEYTIELDEVDNKSDKTEAVSAANKLVGDKAPVYPLPQDRSLQTQRFRRSVLPARTRRLPRAMTTTSAFASLIRSRER